METEQQQYLPPMNREAEAGVLGSILIDPDGIPRVREVLNSRSFYLEVNKWVYEAMLALDDKNDPIDIITVADELRRLGKLDDVGGESYLIGLVNTTPTHINESKYARIVEETGERRQMIRAASYMAELAHDESIPLEQAIDKAMEENFKIGSSMSRSSTVHIREPASELMEQVEIRSKLDTNITGIPTGFTDMDRLLGGLQRSELTVFAGRPGMGKSALQSTIAMLASTKYDAKVAVFSLEMSSVQWVLRTLAGMANINNDQMKFGDMSEGEWANFYDKVGQLSQTGLFIDDAPMLTPAQLRAKARRLYQEYGLDLLFVDYLQLMQTTKDFHNRVQEVGFISSSLKALAKELDIAVCATSQLSRGVEQRQDKRPVISDLRDSGNIEQDADVIGLLYRDEYYFPDSSERPNIAELNFAKNRNGHTGVIDLYWNGPKTRFNNLQRQEINL